MGDERRSYTRVSFPKILVKVPSARRFREEFLRDLSTGGLFVATTKTLRVGRQVEVSLSPPGRDEPLEVIGRVVRVEDAKKGASRAGMAIQFEDLTSEIVESLNQLIAEYVEEEEAAMKAAARSSQKGVAEETERLQKDLETSRRDLRKRERAVEKAEGEIEELRSQLAEVRKERDRLRGEKAALEEEVSSAGRGARADSHEIEAARRGSQRLQDLLDDAEERAKSLQKELLQHEQDEAVTRGLAERLATEKKKLEEKSAERGAQIDRLQEELEETRRGLEREVERLRERAENAEERLEAGRVARSELEGAIGEERRARTEAEARADRAAGNLEQQKEAVAKREELDAELRQQQVDLRETRACLKRAEARASETHAELERTKARERELRRLLSMVHSREETGEAPPEGEAEVVRVEEESSDPGRDTMGVDVVNPSATGEAGEGSKEKQDKAEDKTEAPPPVAAQLASPPTAAAAAVEHSPAELADTESLVARAQEILAGLRESVPTGGKIETVEQFADRLRSGAVFKKTDRFFRLEPVSRVDIQVSDWLRNADNFQELQELAGGRMPDDDLIETVYLFYQRALLSLEN